MPGLSRAGGSAARPWRFSSWGLVAALVFLLVCGAGLRLVKLRQQEGQPLMPDVRLYCQLGSLVSLERPFFLEREPLMVWFNRACQGAGWVLGLPPERAVRLGTGLLSLITLGLAFFLARLWLGDWAALLAALYLALSPFLATFDVSGGRDGPFLLLLVGFCRLALGPAGRVWPRALALGLVGGLMCLVRMNALGVVVLVSAWGLWRAEGRGMLRPWLGALAICALLCGPYLVYSWHQTGDPLQVVNRHAAWVSSHLEPGAAPASSFGSYFLSRWGLAKLTANTIKGMFNALAGPVAKDSFFAGQSLPWGLGWVALLMFLAGLVLAVRRRLWTPILLLLVLTGPVWPLIAAGLDPRLLTPGLPLYGVFLALTVQEGVRWGWDRTGLG